MRRPPIAVSSRTMPAGESETSPITAACRPCSCFLIAATSGSAAALSTTAIRLGFDGHDIEELLARLHPKDILIDGEKRARREAQKTMAEVHHAMKLGEG